MRTIALEWTGENGEECAVEFPAKFEVCGRCEGEGSILNPSIGEHAYTQEEFHEAFPEPEDREHYFAGGNGIYGVTCPECKGKGLVLGVDEEKLTTVGKASYESYKKWAAEDAREREAEARTCAMERGGY